jgi:hypothetical protein
MQINTGISIVSLVVSVIILALVLMLFAGKPWKSSPVERETSEAQRLETCAFIGDIHHRGLDKAYKGDYIKLDGISTNKLIAQAIIDNQCADNEIGWE